MAIAFVAAFAGRRPSLRSRSPGSNLAVSFHDLLRNGNTLYVSYGKPAAPQTLNRLIVKYIFSYGGAAGT